MRSRVKSARGIISPFPIMASNIDKADKPLMFSGSRKFVHWTRKPSPVLVRKLMLNKHFKFRTYGAYTNITTCAIGIHIKRSVAVHPDIDPTNLTPFSESLPMRAWKYEQLQLQKSPYSQVTIRVLGINWKIFQLKELFSHFQINTMFT